MDILINIWKSMPDLVSVLYLITVIFVAFLIILENRNPEKTISWILVLILLPFVGIIIYLFFGQQYRCWAGQPAGIQFLVVVHGGHGRVS